jgi:preprotein translocase subunit SecF
MIRLFDNANYDLLGARKKAYVVTAVMAVAGLAALAVRGVNSSIEFTGGTLIQVHAVDSTITTARIRGALDAAGIAGSELSSFGTERDFVIRARLTGQADDADTQPQAVARAVEGALTTAFGPGSFTVDRAEAITPKVGGELRTKALLAILLSFGATLVYVTFRFEWRFGIATILATAHDILLTVCFIALMHLEISLVVIAAILTIVGYSMNDTIVVFDRVRENLHKYKRDRFKELLNRSVNETLPRTVLTGGSTIAATLALLIFAGPVIRAFAWVMTFGLIVGTFSSIFIASPVLLAIERRWPGEDVRGAKAMGAATAAPGVPTQVT